MLDAHAYSWDIMKENILQTINSPEDIRRLSPAELEKLAADIRD